MPGDDCKNLPRVLFHSQTGSSSIRVFWAGFGSHILGLTLGRCFILRTCPVSPWPKVFCFFFFITHATKSGGFCSDAVVTCADPSFHSHSSRVLKRFVESWANSGSFLFPEAALADCVSRGRLAHAVLGTSRQWKHYWMKQKWLVLAKQWDHAHIVNYPLFPTARIFQLPKPS